MTNSPAILALDPSLSCTGWALLYGTNVNEAGTINVPSKGTVWQRIAVALDDIDGLIVNAGKITVVVETPQTITRGKMGQRSASSLPNYGMLVGAVLAHIRAKHPGVDLREVSATEWTKHAPSTNGDRDKVRRVQAVEYHYPQLKGKLGAKTKAGNVADAILMGRWWAERADTLERTA